VDAAPLLGEVARRLNEVNLEAVLIGNAGAALQGAPVTTVDFDFMFRKTARNLAKMKDVARALGAVILRPYYPVSDLYRVVRDEDGHVDFKPTIHDVRAFAGLRDRATTIQIGGAPVRVASVVDLARERKRNLRELVDRWQWLPPERRTQFLRKRVAPGRSVL